MAQDGAILVGIPIGVGEQVVADVQGLIELIKDPKAAYDAVAALATDPEVRRPLGAAVLADIDAKLAVFNRAIEYGGLQNSVAAGQVIGSVAITLAGAATGAYGAVRGATKVASIGVRLTARERQVLDALGVPKNTVTRTVTLADGSIVNTIFDASGRNVGGFLEIKNVASLSFSPQIRAQLDIATSARAPLNIVVSPITTRVTRQLQRQVEQTGGGVFVFNPSTGTLQRLGR